MTGKVNKCILNGNIQIAFSSTIITDCGQVSRASRGYDKPEPPAIHDDLKARVLLVKSDKKEMVLISCDFGGFDLYEINKIKEQIKRIGISPCNVTIFCSHTHAGFDKINSGKIGEKLANIIKKSRKNMVSASVGFLEVNAGTGININRRVVLPDGYGVFCIMYNTDCTIGSNKLNCTKQVRKQFEALGLDCRKANILKKPVYTDRPVDTTLNAIYFKDDKGKLLGSFVRFSGHACVVSSKHIGNRISADYVGYLCRKVEKELGGICLFGNGPSGDIRMLYRENTFKEAERFGNLLAGKVIDNFKKTDYRPLVSCGVIQKEVDFPVNKKFPKTVEAGKEKSEYLKKEILQRIADRKDIRGIKTLYDEKYYIESKTRLFSRDRHTWDECLSGKLKREVQYMYFNDIGIAALPGEIFTKIGQRIKNEIGKEKVFTVSLANSYLCYFPPKEEYGMGAYEVGQNLLAPDSVDRLVNESVLLSRYCSES